MTDLVRELGEGLREAVLVKTADSLHLRTGCIRTIRGVQEAERDSDGHLVEALVQEPVVERERFDQVPDKLQALHQGENSALAVQVENLGTEG